MSSPKTLTPPAKKANVSPPDEQSPTQPEVCCEKIREAAYFKWETAGCPCSDGVEFWLAAEAELSSAGKNPVALSKPS